MKYHNAVFWEKEIHFGQRFNVWERKKNWCDIPLQNSFRYRFQIFSFFFFHLLRGVCVIFKRIINVWSPLYWDFLFSLVSPLHREDIKLHFVSFLYFQSSRVNFERLEDLLSSSYKEPLRKGFLFSFRSIADPSPEGRKCEFKKRRMILWGSSFVLGKRGVEQDERTKGVRIRTGNRQKWRCKKVEIVLYRAKVGVRERERDRNVVSLLFLLFFFPFFSITISLRSTSTMNTINTMTAVS